MDPNSGANGSTPVSSGNSSINNNSSSINVTSSQPPAASAAGQQPQAAAAASVAVGGGSGNLITGSSRDNTTASNNQHVAKNNHVATTPSASSHVLATCSSCGSCNSIQLVHVADNDIVNSSSGPQQQSKMTTEYDEGSSIAGNKNSMANSDHLLKREKYSSRKSESDSSAKSLKKSSGGGGASGGSSTLPPQHQQQQNQYNNNIEHQYQQLSSNSNTNNNHSYQNDNIMNFEGSDVDAGNSPENNNEMPPDFHPSDPNGIHGRSEPETPPVVYPPSTWNTRSRQKKFMKTFSQLPQEEIVLQRYSCALVADILLQGHLYITENYFAFYSNVFGYVTKLQIPIRSVVKISKEKTARIIPNAVGLETSDEKHVFSSLLSRDSTFKFLNHVWRRALKDRAITLAGADSEEILNAGTQTLSVDALRSGVRVNLADEATTDDDEDDEADGDEDVDVDKIVEEVGAQPLRLLTAASADGYAEDESLLVEQAELFGLKRRSTTSGRLSSIGDPAAANNGGGLTPSCETPLIGGRNSRNNRRNNSNSFFGFFFGGGGGGQTLNGGSWLSPALTILVICLLCFLLASSLYLIFRISSIQREMDDRFYLWSEHKGNDESPKLMDTESTERIKKVISNNLASISKAKKTLELANTLLRSGEDVEPNSESWFNQNQMEAEEHPDEEEPGSKHDET